MIAKNKPELSQSSPAKDELQSARRIHPEDLVVGDDIALTEVSHQYGTFAWYSLDTFKYPADEVITLTYRPSGDHFPQKVVSICLPFLLCELVTGKHVIHDVRTVQLTRLQSGFAKAARAAFKSDKESEETEKKSQEKKKRKKGKKKKK